ncbi:MAG: MBL fold metallo-hydrolase [Lachnospiraceae bacterium]|nr:MBL fold metallo-hydrolase [Lachnospiraceae bacterium]
MRRPNPARKSRGARLDRAIKGVGIGVSDITYILATHFHPDHIGLVSELMDQGVGLLVMDTQIESIHYSDEIFAREPRLCYRPIDESRANSKDSISIVLDTGCCIVGDLEPIEYLEAYENNDALARDWDKLLSFKPVRICYAYANDKCFDEP